ncbi:DUF6443 domain-containing protein [Aquimarina algiphila]|uniref:DUF6443 domain-containing protein n=1 Tax=Aquimarina algiphila TaxID=2047982 RepID=UPI002493C3BF|nr:DUF6443 domain-containing protein [Aquimarina algiphila]
MKTYILLFIVLLPLGISAQIVDGIDPDPDCPAEQQIRYYWDLDLDGVGAGPVILLSCKILSGEEGEGLSRDYDDCDDNDADAKPGAKWYIDLDKDGFGDMNSSPINQCLRPVGPYVANNLDCNDSEFNVRGIQTYYLDADGDGYGSRKNNEKINACNGLPAGYSVNNYDYDDDDPLVIDAPLRLVCPPQEKRAVYIDRDRDGYGTGFGMLNCDSPPDGYSWKDGDCDDNNPLIALKYYYEDNDKDGFGDPNKRVPCDYFGLFSLDIVTGEIVQNPLYVENALDCDDSNPLVLDGYFFYRDKDGDTFGNKFVKVKSCSQPSGYVANFSDCDDDDATITANIIWYEDKDRDGFGDPNKTVMSCDQPDGYVDNALDSCPTQGGPDSGCISSVVDGFTDKNYIHTIVPQQPFGSITPGTNRDQLIETVDYFDDRGRLTQQIAIRGGENFTKNDIVTRVEYDIQGRQRKEYLPYATSGTRNGGFYSNAALETNSFYDTSTYENTLNPYSEKIIEASPLNRVQKQAAPGNDWKVGAVTNPIPVPPPSNLPVDIVINNVVNAASSTSERNPTASSSITLTPGAWIQSNSNFTAKINAGSNPDNTSGSANDHTIKFDWDTNIADEVVYFKVVYANPGDTKVPTLVTEGYYKADELYVTITKDENWQSDQVHINDHTTKEYKDKQGRVLLKRTYNQNIAHDTYYVYDDYNNLTYVIPPKVITNDGVSNNELIELCYQYSYDYRNRLIEKKIPGKGKEFIVYNKLDQPILTQDANQKAQNVWLFTKYDRFGRVAYTGKKTDTRERAILQSEATAYGSELWVTRDVATTIGGVLLDYNDGGYPKVSTDEVLTINYYDDYNFDKAGLTTPVTVYGEAVSSETKSLSTGSKVKVLDTNDWITSVTYYDQKARLIYTASKNEYLNTTDVIENKLDFVGKVEETKTTHVKGNNPVVITIDTFEYDHVNRLINQIQKIGNQSEELIVENAYDPLGRLASKKVGGAITPGGIVGLQTVDYSYNVRGWLKGINDANILGNDLFAFALDYNTGINPLYNGNISKTSWQTANDNVTRSYDYTYDALNRIVTGISNDGNYNLSGITYDKMGNILSLNRIGHLNEAATSFGVMDNLGYTYDVGNKLLKVTDTGNTTFGFKDGTNTNDDFTYDDNGNMITDQNKGITGITYNHLNLPKTVSISNSVGTGNISYIYDATGAKLKKIAPSGSSLIETEYAGNYIYKNGSLQYMSTPEGYATPNGSSYQYVYQFKDHLDNVRLSYTKNDAGNLEIIEENNYYPFGLTHKGYNNTISSLGNSIAQLLKFGGKEEQNELGLNWLDYGARNYDPTIGKWFNIDPQAEKYYDQSPFTYGLNNPNYFIDPNGEEIDVTALLSKQNANGEDKTEEELKRDQFLLDNLLLDLTDISGQEITVTTTKDGRSVLTGSGECDGDCTEAAAFVSHLLSDEGTITVSGTNEKTIGFPSGAVDLNASEINGIQEGLRDQGLDPRAYSTGLTLLHESLHTKFGASFFNSSEDQKDKLGGRFIDSHGGELGKGAVVTRTNRFREQLGLPTREIYRGQSTGFGQSSLIFKKDGNEFLIPQVNIKPKK